MRPIGVGTGDSHAPSAHADSSTASGPQPGQPPAAPVHRLTVRGRAAPPRARACRSPCSRRTRTAGTSAASSTSSRSRSVLASTLAPATAAQVRSALIRTCTGGSARHGARWPRQLEQRRIVDRAGRSRPAWSGSCGCRPAARRPPAPDSCGQRAPAGRAQRGDDADRVDLGRRRRARRRTRVTQRRTGLTSASRAAGVSSLESRSPGGHPADRRGDHHDARR